MRTKYKDWGHEDLLWDWYDDDEGYILFENDGTIHFNTKCDDADEGWIWACHVELKSDVAKELYEAMKKFYEKDIKK